MNLHEIKGYFDFLFYLGPVKLYFLRTHFMLRFSNLLRNILVIFLNTFRKCGDVPFLLLALFGTALF